MAAKPGSNTLRNTTPVTPARNVPPSQKSTKAPQHRLPVSTAGPLTLAKRTPTAAVTGPSVWANSKGPVETPGQRPPLSGASPADVHPCGNDCTQP